MSIASGFFDTLVENNEYDRAYGSQDFVDYFANVVGSGVAISNNPNSMLVYIDGTDAIVSAGYLFIDGYWLKNSTGYTISLSSAATGNYVIVARLSRSNRSIILRYEPESDSYVDCLVLAKITKPSVGSITSQDTRSDTSICGTIDTISSLNDAVNLALDNVATFSEQIEVFQTTLNNQALLIAQKFSEVDAIETDKIAEANALLASTESPVVGSVQYSAQSPGNKWLRCDGSLVTTAQYPDLVALIKSKQAISPTSISQKFSLDLGRHVSNILEFDGCYVVLSLSLKKIVFIDMITGTIAKEVSVPWIQRDFTLSDYNPVTISIVDVQDNRTTDTVTPGFNKTYKFFVAQNSVNGYFHLDILCTYDPTDQASSSSVGRLNLLDFNQVADFPALLSARFKVRISSSTISNYSLCKVYKTDSSHVQLLVGSMFMADSTTQELYAVNHYRMRSLLQISTYNSSSTGKVYCLSIGNTIKFTGGSYNSMKVTEYAGLTDISKEVIDGIETALYLYDVPSGAASYIGITSVYNSTNIAHTLGVARCSNQYQRLNNSHDSQSSITGIYTGETYFEETHNFTEFVPVPYDNKSASSHPNINPVAVNGGVIYDCRFEEYSGVKRFTIILGDFQSKIKFYQFLATDIPSNSVVCPDGTWYDDNSGIFICLLSTGAVFSFTPLDPLSYAFVSLDSLNDKVIRHCIVDVDTDNDKVVFIGQTQSNRLACVSFSYSALNTPTTGAYLPNIQVSSIDGYIRALR